jgi:hypothetical protein
MIAKQLLETSMLSHQNNSHKNKAQAPVAPNAQSAHANYQEDESVGKGAKPMNVVYSRPDAHLMSPRNAPQPCSKSPRHAFQPNDLQSPRHAPPSMSLQSPRTNNATQPSSLKSPRRAPIPPPRRYDDSPENGVKDPRQLGPSREGAGSLDSQHADSVNVSSAKRRIWHIVLFCKKVVVWYHQK